MRLFLLTVATLALLAVIAAGGVVAWSWQPSITAIDPPKREAFPADQIARGEKLAAIGNCAVCHTQAGGNLNAGGLPLATPFGTIHSTNITPDAETGIGRWSLTAFTRSMRKGVDREGNHLYPAFPYDHFTKVTEADNRDLYAYLMTRPAVHQAAKPNGLPFPLNVRASVAGWKLLFFTEGALQHDASRSSEWNRGAYLSEGLGHCGGCHTPRNALGAEQRERHYDGGEVEGWTAYAINSRSQAPARWSVDALQFYLRNGWHGDHGISRGPMAPVTANLGSVDEADVRAIAVYIGEGMAAATPAPVQRPAPAAVASSGSSDSQGIGNTTAPEDRGGKLYASACASCHEGNRPLPTGGLDLHLSTAVHSPDPTNIVNVVDQGLAAAEGERGAMMPAYRALITDAQMVELLGYLRRTFGQKSPWPDLPSLVAKQRAKAREIADYRTDGHQAAPWRASERVPQ